MKKHLCNVTLLLALGSGLAIAQTMPRQQYPNQTPPTLPESQKPAAGAQTHVPPADPTAVQSDIQKALQNDSTLANSNINVQVNDKDVELTGSVPNKEAKKAAERIAKDRAAGMDVKNHIKVEKTAGAADQTNPKDKDHNQEK
jgi:hypothetical protein